MNPSWGYSADCPKSRKTPNAPKDIYNKENPLPNSPENIKAGEQLFQKKLKPLPCKYCHGEKGDGQGKLARGMKPKPRNFTCSEMMHSIPDGQLFWVIKNGSQVAMPSFKSLNDDEIWKLVLYIRQFAN